MSNSIRIINKRICFLFHIACQYYGSNLPLLRKKQCSFLMLDDGDRRRRQFLVLFLIFSVRFISGTLWVSESAEGGKGTREERASVRESVCNREKEKEKERGEHSDATPSHAPGSNLPIALSGIRKALQSWVEHALVFKLPMANHTSFFFCKREPSSKTARFQKGENAIEHP